MSFNCRFAAEDRSPPHADRNSLGGVHGHVGTAPHAAIARFALLSFLAQSESGLPLVDPSRGNSECLRFPPGIVAGMALGTASTTTPETSMQPSPENVAVPLSRSGADVASSPIGAEFLPIRNR
jgi:hypothetical protein